MLLICLPWLLTYICSYPIADMGTIADQGIYPQHRTKTIHLVCATFAPLFYVLFSMIEECLMPVGGEIMIFLLSETKRSEIVTYLV